MEITAHKIGNRVEYRFVGNHAFGETDLKCTMYIENGKLSLDRIPLYKPLWEPVCNGE